MQSKLTLVTLLIAALVGIGILVLDPFSGDAKPRENQASLPTLPEATRAPRTTMALAPVPVVEVRATREELGDTTVLWPMRVKLDLFEAAYLPKLERGERIGSGRTARLSGRLARTADKPIRAAIHFIAGPNEGRVLHTDSSGRFGSNTLHPGLSIVEVRGDGVLSRREVRLSQGQEALLNIGYGRPSGMFGRVVDGKGEGITGVKVVLDGHVTYTADDGEFLVTDIAGGSVLLELSSDGLSAYREIVHLTSGRVVPRNKLTFVMRPSASLRISISDRVGGPGPVEIWLLPSEAGTQIRREASYPWYKLGVIRIEPGSSRVISGLPGKPLKILAFRAGATIPRKLVHLRSGEESQVILPLSPAARLTGRVTHRGKPVPGALVRMQPPNQTRATASFFAVPGFTLQHEVMPLLPVAEQTARTDTEGRFVFTAWSELSSVRYIEARGPDGDLFASQLVRGAEEHIELELEDLDIADATLELLFPERWQGLPVEVTIDGGAVEPVVVPPHEPLVINDLMAGRWSISATWYGENVHPEEIFELAGRLERSIHVPDEAIEGQDEEAWGRAGRDFPYQ